MLQQGRQCVHIAAANGCCDVLRVLQSARANLNAEDKVYTCSFIHWYVNIICIPYLVTDVCSLTILCKFISIYCIAPYLGYYIYR